MKVELCVLPTIHFTDKKSKNTVIIESTKYKTIVLNNGGLLADYQIKEKFNLTSGILFFREMVRYNSYNYDSLRDPLFLPHPEWGAGYYAKLEVYYSNKDFLLPIWLGYRIFKTEKIELNTSSGVNYYLYSIIHSNKKYFANFSDTSSFYETDRSFTGNPGLKFEMVFSNKIEFWVSRHLKLFLRDSVTLFSYNAFFRYNVGGGVIFM